MPTLFTTTYTHPNNFWTTSSTTTSTASYDYLYSSAKYSYDCSGYTLWKNSLKKKIIKEKEITEDEIMKLIRTDD